MGYCQLANMMWFLNGQLRTQPISLGKASIYFLHGESRFSIRRMGRRRENPRNWK